MIVRWKLSAVIPAAAIAALTGGSAAVVGLQLLDHRQTARESAELDAVRRGELERRVLRDVWLEREGWRRISSAEAGELERRQTMLERGSELELMEPTGTYVKRAGDTMNGTLAVPQILMKGAVAGNPINWVSTVQCGLNGSACFRYSGNILRLYAAGADRLTVNNGSGAIVLAGGTSITGQLDVAGAVTSTSIFQATTYFQSLGSTQGSLPTCNAGTAGSLQYNISAKRLDVCDDETGGFQWNHISISSAASGPIDWVAALDGGAAVGPPYVQPSTPGASLGIRVASLQSSAALVGQAGEAAPDGGGFCTSPSILNANGTYAFVFDVGSACAVSTGTIKMPGGTNGYDCVCQNRTSAATRMITQTSSTTTAVVIQSRDWAGAAANWVSGDDISCQCQGY